MFWQIVTVENYKTFKRPIFWVELALLVTAIASLYIAVYALSQPQSADQPPAEALQVLTGPAGIEGAVDMVTGSFLGGVIMIVLVGAVVAQEYTWHTMRLWLSRGVSRTLFVGVKFLALLMPILLIVLTSLLAGSLITAIFGLKINGTLPFGQVDWLQLLLRAGRVAYSMLPYTALAFFLAILSRSALVAISVSLAYTLAGEGYILQLLAVDGGAWTQIGRYLPAGLVHSLQQSNAGLSIEGVENTLAASPYLEPGAAAIGIALYTLLFVGLSILIFRRQDLND